MEYRIEEIGFPDGDLENPATHTITVETAFNSHRPPVLAARTVLDLDGRGLWFIDAVTYRPRSDLPGQGDSERITYRARRVTAE